MENDIFRRKRTNLSTEQLLKIDLIKCEAEKLLIAMTLPSATVEQKFMTDLRCLSIAKTKLEESVMWAIKGFSKINPYYEAQKPSSPDCLGSIQQDEPVHSNEY